MTYNLQQYQSLGNGKARHVATVVWNKVYAIVRSEYNKQMAQKQAPGTFFKIVRNQS